jgi:hypothetical protein
MVSHSVHIYTKLSTPERTRHYFTFKWFTEIPLKTGGTFHWCQHLPPHFHDIETINWFARLHCSLTSSKVQVFSSERTVLWGQFKLRNPKITTIFGTNTCENPEGLIMESIAAPESYLVGRLESELQSFFSKSSQRGVRSARNTLLHNVSTTTAG